MEQENCLQMNTLDNVFGTFVAMRSYWLNSVYTLQYFQKCEIGEFQNDVTSHLIKQF